MIEECYNAHSLAPSTSNKHLECSNCSLIKELISFKKEIFVSSFSLKQLTVQYFKATVAAIDNDYRNDLLEDLMVVCVIRFAENGKDLLNLFQDVIENQVISILVGIHQKYSFLQEPCTQFLSHLGAIDRLTAIKYQSALLKLDKHPFNVEIFAQWCIDYDLDLALFLNRYFSKFQGKQNITKDVFNILHGKFYHPISNSGSLVVILRAICGLVLFGSADLEVETLVEFTTSRPVHSESAVQLRQLQICLFLLSVPITSPGNSIVWGRIKITLEDLFSAQTDGLSQILSVYLFSNDVERFHDSISSILKWPVKASMDRYKMIKSMNSELFSREKISDLCLNLMDSPHIPSVDISLLLHLLKFKVVSFAGSDLGLAMQKLFARTKLVDEMLIEVVSLFVDLVFASDQVTGGIPLNVRAIGTEKALLTYYNLLYRERSSVYHGELEIKETSGYIKRYHPALYPHFIALVAKQFPFAFAAPIILLEGQQHVKVVNNARWDASVIERLRFRNNVDQKELAKFEADWILANCENPYVACVELLTGLAGRSMGSEIMDFISNPTLLTSSISLLMRADLISVVVHILTFSYSHFKFHVEKHNLASKEKERTILLYSSLLVQSLIVFCHECTAPDRDRKYIVHCIFEFLHQQFFVENMNLTRLIHFQTYSIKMIPELVDKIPSLHVCIDIVPDLLQSQETHRVEFGIFLGAFLCKKYPMQSTRNLADLILATAGSGGHGLLKQVSEILSDLLLI